MNLVTSGLQRILLTCKTLRRNFSNSSRIFSPSLEPNISALIPPVTRCIRIILSAHFSIISGSAKKRRVCPVGAVSNTITSQSGFSRCLSNSSNAIASSNPGRIISDAFKSGFSPPINGPKLSVSFGMWSEILASGSNSKPHNPSTPSTAVGSGPNCTPRLSDVLCAGSLLTKRTFRPESANPTAVEVEVVVLPTPPFPPKRSSRAIS